MYEKAFHIILGQAGQLPDLLCCKIFGTNFSEQQQCSRFICSMIVLLYKKRIDNTWEHFIVLILYLCNIFFKMYIITIRVIFIIHFIFRQMFSNVFKTVMHTRVAQSHGAWHARHQSCALSSKYEDELKREDRATKLVKINCAAPA